MTIDNRGLLQMEYSNLVTTKHIIFVSNTGIRKHTKHINPIRYFGKHFLNRPFSELSEHIGQRIIKISLGFAMPMMLQNHNANGFQRKPLCHRQEWLCHPQYSAAFPLRFHTSPCRYGNRATPSPVLRKYSKEQPLSASLAKAEDHHR